MAFINLDHMSYKPMLPEVKAAMKAAIDMEFLNPSSMHKRGEAAAAALDRSREALRRLLNCADAKEVVFTSGGTESVNHAIKGAAAANIEKGRHLIISNIEHNAVIRSAKRLQAMGFTVTSVSVDGKGRVDPDEIAAAITGETVLVSVMHSNNETGTLQPIEQIAEITRRRKVLLHTDAVDSVGVVPIDVQRLGVDLLSFSANAFHGPTGVGGLYIRKGARVFPMLDGGVQEHNKRAGTENLIGIIGAGVAAEQTLANLERWQAHTLKLKHYLLEQLPRYIDEYIVNTHPVHSLPSMLSVSIQYIEGESVLLMLDDEEIAISTRSACATGSLRASHVLTSIGLSHADAQGTLVISFGKDNTEAQIDRFLAALKHVVATLREISPLYRKTPR
jgi:cysteine desulfurase